MINSSTEIFKEEYIENSPTGVEVEEDSSAENEHDPWNPEEIRIHTRNFSLRNILDMVNESELDLTPDFQRLFTWKEKQQCGLIESLLLGIPLPSFYFDQDYEGYLQVVDGVQRITTIHRFTMDEFCLSNLTYLKNLEGRYFSELELPLRRRLYQSQFVVHVIDPQTPYKVKFDIFRRINTGGEPLNAQEIRHCMSRPQSRNFLQYLANSEEFLEATAHSMANHVRMADKEVVLRIIAFQLLGPNDYMEAGSLDVFLGRATQVLDSTSEQHLHELEVSFRNGMQNAYLIFGENSFRKWPLYEMGRRAPINRALCEVWGNVLSRYETGILVEHKEEIVMKARRMMTDDYSFIGSISGSTGAIYNVKTRFAKIYELMKGIVHD